MKKLYPIIALVIIFITGSYTLKAQVPDGFNYQAVARNAAGEVLASTTLSVRVAIVSDINSSTVYWEEEHTVQTNAFGLLTLLVGDAAATYTGGIVSNFSDIDWTLENMFLRPSIKQGTAAWQVMTPTKISSVPYAILARDTESKQQLSLSGDNLLLTDGGQVSLSKNIDPAQTITLSTNTLTLSGGGPTVDLSKYLDNTDNQMLSMSGDNLNLDRGGSVSLSKYNSPFSTDADTLYRINGSLSLGSDRPMNSKLAVVSTDDTSDEPLFEVRRNDGQPVFSVYNDGVQIHVNDLPTKGPRGGFAIGGFEKEAKGVFQNYLMIAPDSIRMFIKEEAPAVKGPSRGGFAIGGFDDAKGFVSNYFNVSGKSDVDLYDDVAQILWYPRKEALLAGRITIPDPDSVGVNSTSFGYHSMAKGDFSQAFGHEAKATASNSTAIGNQATARGMDSYAFGSGALAKGQRSFAFGSVGVDENGVPTSTITLAQGDFSTAFGMGAQSTQTAAMALGVNSLASGYASTALGFYSQATDYYAVAIGYYSKSTNRYAHSFGLGAEASGYGSLAMGMYSKAQGNYASSMGYYSEAKNQFSVAIGYYAKAQADYSAAFGRSAQANGASSVAVGYGTIAGGVGAAAFGRSAVASGESSLSMGYSTGATQLYSTAIGYNSQSIANYTTALGYNATANQPYATAIGYLAQATGQDSYSFGSSSIAHGTKSVSIGISTNADANYSVAIGNGATATGDYATSLGYQTAANGLKSIAIGAFYNYTYYRFVFNKLTGGYVLTPVTVNKANIANGDYSISLGNGNTTYDGGLALGTNNTARKIGSVAIGFSNYADSAYSFAAGYGNYATGINAFALGESVTAQSANSFVIGTYNVIEGTKDDWVSSDPLFVVGNGESSSVRSNAFKITKNGNAYLSGYFQTPASYNNTVFIGRDAYISSSGYLGTISSSIRYKENVEDMEEINWIYNLHPVTFNYIEDEQKNIQYGLIAEEVVNVNKDFVCFGEDGLPETVYYSRFMTPLIKAVQQQKTESDELFSRMINLQSENDDLRNLNEELASRLEQLESLVNQLLEKH